VVARLLDYAQKIEGLYRNASTHAAGVVIGDRPLDQLVPLYRDPKSDMPATQFNMKWVEAAGLVKFDFLGLKTLTVIQNAVDLIRAQGRHLHIAADGRTLYDPAAGAVDDIGAIPLDDPATYALYASARTVAVFQVESSGMMDALRACGRPASRTSWRWWRSIAPARWRTSRLLRGQERAARTGIDPPLHRPHPEETQGIIVYQEQVMEIAQVMAGYSAGRRRPAAPRDGQEDRRGDGQGAAQVHRGRHANGVSDKRRARSSTCWRNSPTTASTSPTPRPMRWSATRPPG
jgi:DNA polymerase III subunit alpha